MWELTIGTGGMMMLCLMTFLAGLIDSAAGGGGLISLPAYLSVGLPPHVAFGCNKFSSSCGATLATARFFKGGALDVKIGMVAAVFSFLGSGIASHVVLFMPADLLQRMILLVVPVVAVFLIFRKSGHNDDERRFVLAPTRAVVYAALIGFFIGGYDGLIGPGTGTFAILLFSGAMGYDLRTASGNAKLLNLASNYASLITFLLAGAVALKVAIPCAVFSIAGSLVGSELAVRKGARFIRPMLIVVLCLLMASLAKDVLL